MKLRTNTLWLIYNIAPEIYCRYITIGTQFQHRFKIIDVKVFLWYFKNPLFYFISIYPWFSSEKVYRWNMNLHRIKIDWFYSDLFICLLFLEGNCFVDNKIIQMGQYIWDLATISICIQTESSMKKFFRVLCCFNLRIKKDKRSNTSARYQDTFWQNMYTWWPLLIECNPHIFNPDSNRSTHNISLIRNYTFKR